MNLKDNERHVEIWTCETMSLLLIFGVITSEFNAKDSEIHCLPSVLCSLEYNI